MTRPRISVVDVKVKAMTVGKRKAAGKPKSITVWVGRFTDTTKYNGDLYVSTTRRLRPDCVEAIKDDGLSIVMKPVRALLIPAPPKRRRKQP